MTGTSQDRPRTYATQYDAADQPEQTGWAGWVAFAGFMLILGSCLQVIAGLVALFNSDYYLVRPSGLVVSVSYTTWGWTHILLGVVSALTGVGLLMGNMLARVVGVILAIVMAVVNMVFIPAYPFWALTLITIDIIVIYAITAHGRELKSTY